MKTNLITRLTAAAALAFFLATPGTASAQQMNYQGRATDATGAPIPGPSATLEFNIWDHATSTNAVNKVWGPFSVNADIIDGRFNVSLGPNDTAAPARSIISAFNGSAARYIHVKIGNNAALPRQQIMAAPTALHADRAGHATTAGTAANFTSVVLKTDEVNARVGIGLANPAEKLDVAGNVKVTGNITASGNVTATGNLTASGLTASGDIFAAGTAGIGVLTPLAGHKLQVAGGYSLLDGLRISGLDVDQTIYQRVGNMGIKTHDAGSSIFLGSFVGGTALTVKSGNVGIGTTTPSNRLTVSGNANFTDNVGIGTTSPGVNLDVAGGGTVTMTEVANAIYGGTGNGIDAFTTVGSADLSAYNLANNSYTSSVSIRANRWIASAYGFVAYSDRRIKRDLQASATANDLKAIQQLQVTDYRMVDPADGGNAWRKGFIAQEVEKVIPGAVTRSTEFVPDIFALATAVVYDPAAKTLALTLAKDHGLKAGDRVRLHIDGKRVDLDVSVVPSAREFVVEQCENAPEKVLLYGKQVNDFRTVDYDRIFTTSVGAVQELARKLETQEAESMKLRETNAALRDRMAALEAKDQARDTQLAAIEALLTRDPAKTATVSLTR